MSAVTASPVIIFRRRLVALLAIVALGVAVGLAPQASSRQTMVHAFLAKNGTTVVSGYDGGAPLATAKP
ncbi:MAG TPA: hypothetical protein VHV28_01070 [Solirubrobacteraceae bacterium]|jgi:hypothetical protein|nr:hypothetical protein [Solirubrobacteraceae bacterium]